MTDNVLDSDIQGGRPYQPSHITQLITALNAALVGRVGGVPTSGQSLGSPVIPWGTVYAESLNINGQAINLEGTATTKYALVSGRTLRSDSALSNFINITPNSFNFSIFASPEVPLVLTVNSTEVRIESPISEVAEAPPSANNVIQLNAPSTGWAQFSPQPYRENGQKYLGEIDFAARIQLTNNSLSLFDSNNATNITDKAGQYITLRYSINGVHSYIYGRIVETASDIYQLLDNEREKFFNAAGSGIESLAMDGTGARSDPGGDYYELTLMQTAWVFIGAGGVSEVTNISPIYSPSEPENAENGQYWFDIANNQWKRKTGGEFAPIERIPVAIIISDSTGVVGYRCLDFDRNYQNINTSRPHQEYLGDDFEDFSKRLIGNQNEIVSVYGNLLRPSGARWNAPDPPSGAPQERLTGLDANTWYYFYLSETGTTHISKLRPRYRQDLRGYYHPFESWRCLARTYTDDDSGITIAGYLWLKYNPDGRIPTDINLDRGNQLDLWISPNTLPVVRGGNVEIDFSDFIFGETPGLSVYPTVVARTGTIRLRTPSQGVSVSHSHTVSNLVMSIDRTKMVISGTDRFLIPLSNITLHKTGADYAQAVLDSTLK